MTITAGDENGKRYQAQICFRIKPTAVFVIYSHDGTLTRFGGREYNKISLDPLELVADGKDSLPLAGFFIRADQHLSAEEAFDARLAIGEVIDACWKDSQDTTDLAAPQPDAANEEDGVQVYLAQASRPVQASTERLQNAHRLIFEVKLDPDAESRYRLEANKVEVEVHIQYPQLHLWVVPGVYRHTSTAFAYLEILPSHNPLTGVDVNLTINNPSMGIMGSPYMDLSGSTPPALALSLDHCSEVQQTIKLLTGYITPGSAQWDLKYSGLTWDSLPMAQFSVACGHLDSAGAPAYTVTQVIDVHQNVLDTLAAIYDGPELKKKLNNPYFETEHPFVPIPLDSRGPFWNILQKGDNFAPYVCYQMRNDIIDFLRKRSRIVTDGPISAAVERMSSMNGIEFDFYALRPLHVWAGIFLSGCDRYEDYRALDPWWRQCWTADRKDPDNLMNKWDEKLMAGKIGAEAGGLRLALVETLGWGVSRAAQTIENLLRGSSLLPSWQMPSGGVVHDLVFTSDMDLTLPDGSMTFAQPSWYRKLIEEIKNHAA